MRFKLLNDFFPFIGGNFIFSLIHQLLRLNRVY